MGEVIPFGRFDANGAFEDEAFDVDLVTAVDVAIRDLRDIEHWLTGEAARERASECRRLLCGALERARL